MRKEVVIAFIVLLVLPLGQSQYLSTTPSGINLGEVERGSTNEITFYVDSSADTVYELRPEVEKAPISSIVEIADMENVSERDPSPWIESSQETFTVNPDTEQEYTLPNGENTSAEGAFTVNLNVPQSTSRGEPGFYMASIKPNPQFQNGGAGFGSSTVSVSVPNMGFRIPGNVERSIQMSNAEALRVGRDRVQIVMEFRNTGTVTTSYENFELPIYRDDRRIDSLNIPGYSIPPGESIQVDANWNIGDLEGGVYSLEGPASYRSGQFYIEEDISFTNELQERREVEEPEQDQDRSGKQGSFPIWLFILFLVALASVMYSLDFEFFSISLTVSLIGLAGLIIFTSASNFLLMLLLTSLGVLYYYGG